MNREILTIEKMIPWILIHRTHLSKYGNGPAVLAAYTNELYADYDLLLPHLPPKEEVKNILDIGCGLAGIDIFLTRHYPDAKLYLLESNGPITNAAGGYDSDLKAFCDLKITYEFLTLNGVQVVGNFPVGTGANLSPNLVVSYYSWGFHYPLLKYRVRSKNCFAHLRKDVLSSKIIIDNGGKILDENSKYNFAKFAYDNSSYKTQS